MGIEKQVTAINGKELSQRFKLLQKDEEYILYIDNKLLGRNYIDEYKYNCSIDDLSNKITIFCDMDEIKYLNLSDIDELIEFNLVERNYEKSQFNNH